MNERQFDERLRTWFRDRDDEPAPSSLLSSVAAIPEARILPRPWSLPDLLRSGRALVLLGAAVVLLGLLVGAAALGWRPPVGPFAPATTWDLIIEQQDGDLGAHLFSVVPSQGHAPQPILGGPDFVSASNLAWSPDGRRLAYLVGSQPDQVVYTRYDLYLADGDGHNPLLVSSPEGTRGQGYDVEHGPLWSPDSTMFAIPWTEGDCEGCGGGIDLFNASGTALGTIPAARYDIWPIWAPDSSRLGFVAAPRSVPADTSFGWAPLGQPGDVTVRQLKPDERVIGWIADDRLLVIDNSGPSRAYSVRIDGSDRREVLGQLPEETKVSWSAAGHRILIWRTGDSSLTVRDLESGRDVSIELPEPMSPFLPSPWSPEGDRLVLIAHAGGFGSDYALYLVAADGSEQQRMPVADAIYWRPQP